MSDNLAWCAGFFDGEGCIAISSNGLGCQLHADIGQKYPSVLRLFCDRIGVGSVHDYGRSSPSCPYRWQASGRDVGIALAKMLPYLVVKYEQAQLAIEFAESVGQKGVKTSEAVKARRSQIRLEISRLKKVDSAAGRT